MAAKTDRDFSKRSPKLEQLNQPWLHVARAVGGSRLAAAPQTHSTVPNETRFQHTELRARAAHRTVSFPFEQKDHFVPRTNEEDSNTRNSTRLTRGNGEQRVGVGGGAEALDVPGAHAHSVGVALNQVRDLVEHVARVVEDLLSRQWHEGVKTAPLHCNHQNKKDSLAVSFLQFEQP